MWEHCKGFYTKDKPDNKLDIMIVEATVIPEDGVIVPGASVCDTPEMIQIADKIIIKVNTRIPSFEGFYDIVMGCTQSHRKPFLIMNTQERIDSMKYWNRDD